MKPTPFCGTIQKPSGAVNTAEPGAPMMEPSATPQRDYTVTAPPRDIAGANTLLAVGPCCDVDPAEREFYQRSQRLLYALDWDGFLTTSREHDGLVCQVAYSQPNPFLRPQTVRP